MGNVKSAFEKAMEKIGQIEPLTAEEKEKIKEKEKLKSVLASFFKGDISRDDLWKGLKGSTPSLLKEAQIHIVESIRLNSSPEDIQQKKDGILAIESLKQKQNVSAIESLLNSIKKLQKEYEQGKENAIEELRKAMEANPQLRIKPVRTPDGRIAYQPTVSVDEAVQARLAEFLEEHESRYEEAFNIGIERLKKELR